MFHKNLDQASKRYKGHPNVAAMYTSLLEDKANRSERTRIRDYFPKVRDFAYEQHDSVTDNTRAFIANFASFGFRSYHRRVNNGDLLSKAGILGYEKENQLPGPSVNLKTRVPGLFDMDYHHPPQHQERPTSGKSTVKSESSDLSGTTDTPSLATSATTESPDDENNDNDRRLRGVHDDSLFRAVAVCMLEYMS